MSLHSGADIAAGPIRLDQRSDNPLTMARPLLLVIALWQFMERDKYPEVVVSFMLQLWRSHLTRGRWPSHPTDISRKDVEAQAPTILNSRTSAASFFSFEQLGVTPPPAGGWVPRDADQETHTDHTEWWGNIKTTEWMYHSSEDKYFHVPSSTLWERRETECCDPGASPHTYCRVDAVHLTALSHFAKTMDTALLPMVWKAWTFYTRKRNGRYLAAQRPPEPPPEAGPPRPASIDAAADNSRSLADSGERTDGPYNSAAGEELPGDAAAGKGTFAAEDTEAPLAPAEVKLLATAAAGVEQLVADPQALKKALTSTADTLDAKAPAAPIPSSPAEANSLLGGRPRGWCLCFRVRGRWSRTRCASESSDVVHMDTGIEVSSKGLGSEVLTKSQVGAMPGLGKAAMSSAVSWEEEPQETVKEAPKTGFEQVDKHMRRLHQFLAEVKRNPQRLVTHVEKRRSERTHLAFMVL